MLFEILTLYALAGSGVKELVKAKEIQKSARKKMCCIVSAVCMYTYPRRDDEVLCSV